MTASGRRKVLIVGGGIAGLTAAYELTRTASGRAAWDVEVIEMGHRFGGRLASAHRPERWLRNEEHGLHVWFGFYDNTFRLANEVWRDWNAPADCPWSSLWDGLRPIYCSDHGYLTGEGYKLWRMHHVRNADVPGLGARTWTAQLTGALDFVRAMLDTGQQRVGAPRAAQGRRDFIGRMLWPSPNIQSPVRAAEAVLRPILGRITKLSVPNSPAGRRRVGLAIHRLLSVTHRRAVEAARRASRGNPIAEEYCQWLDVLIGAAKGVTDPRHGIMEDGDFDRVSHLELREFLTEQGVSEKALWGHVLDTVYDMPFAYKDGDRDKPVLEASTALRFSARILFDYKHAIAYLLSAGAGETLVAPLYELLKERGVKFTPFHRLQELVLSEDGRSVQRLNFVRAARVKGDYDPLVTHGGLRGFSAEPDWQQLKEGHALKERGVDFYSRFADRGETDNISLQHGPDFDDVILALPLGCIAEDGDGHTPVRDWLHKHPAARTCINKLHLVPTVAAQVWLNSDRDATGLRDRAVVTWAKPYSVMCDMSPVIKHEGWPEPRPKSCVYLCGAWPLSAPSAPSHDQQAPERDRAVARKQLEHALMQHGTEWFGGPQDLHHPKGTDPYAAQYIRANVEPWDLADLALPGADAVRLDAADTGLMNMALAGAWVRTPVNTTSVEAAVSSGIAAARALGAESREIFGESFLRRPSRNPVLPGRIPKEATAHVPEYSPSLNVGAKEEAAS